jgi:DedD protein
MAEQQEDVDTLKRRGRRRLVGAVALVLLAVIVLPMVFDPEPRRTAPPVSVRIPGEDDSAFTPKAPPKPAPAPKTEEKKDTPEKAEKAAPPPVAAKKAEAKKAEGKKPEPKSGDRTRAEAALANAEYIVPVGAFTNADAVIAKLAAAKVPYYTEKIATANGAVTRVRAGPFATRSEADKALETLKGLGFKPGTVGTKTG